MPPLLGWKSLPSYTPRLLPVLPMSAFLRLALRWPGYWMATGRCVASYASRCVHHCSSVLYLEYSSVSLFSPHPSYFIPLLHSRSFFCFSSLSFTVHLPFRLLSHPLAISSPLLAFNNNRDSGGAQLSSRCRDLYGKYAEAQVGILAARYVFMYLSDLAPR